MKLFVIITLIAAVRVEMAFSRRVGSKKGREMCLSGDGQSYRGSAQISFSGHTCLNWNNFKTKRTTTNGLGNHNFCRNPNQKPMPWCFVRRRQKIVREYCNIPTCPTPKPVTTPAQPMDTELTCGERSERRMHKIVGGYFTPIEFHPWVAAIYHKRSDFLCGGSLISPCWVLTAAHCFSEGKHTKIQHLSVHLGKTDITYKDANREQEFTVENLIIHEEYDDYSYNNDIALIKIQSKNGVCATKSSSVRTVCLPPLHTQLPAGFTCSIAGFGKERASSFQYSKLLKETKVKLISNDDCNGTLHYEDRITKNMLCAASPDWSTDACKGDSGGPLVCEVSDRMFLFGVVSWGEGCAMKNKPGVYTQVTNYNKWIARKTGLSKYTKGLMYPHK